MIVLGRRQLLCGMAGAVGLAACRDQSVSAHKDEAADPLGALGDDGVMPSELRIGITPSRGAETHKLLQPLFEYLSSRLDISVRGVTAASYEDLAGLMSSQSIELGVFSPAAYVVAQPTMHAVAIATATLDGSPTYLGYIVTRGSEYGIRPTLAELKGKTIAWVNKDSTSGYLYPRAMLAEKGIDADAFFGEPQFADNHEEALRRVIEGDVDVAAAASPFVNPESHTTVPGSTKLVVVAKTRRIPLDCVAIHKRIRRDLAKSVRSALLAMVHDNNGTSAKLDATWGLDGFVKPMRYDEVAAVLKDVERG